jgi:hypothetical protein
MTHRAQWKSQAQRGAAAAEIWVESSAAAGIETEAGECGVAAAECWEESFAAVGGQVKPAGEGGVVAATAGICAERSAAAGV